MDHWTSAIAVDLLDVPHLHLTLTTYDASTQCVLGTCVLRPFFCQLRSLSKALLSAAAQTLREVLGDLYPEVRVGIVEVVHPFGRDRDFKPHVHLVLTNDYRIILPLMLAVMVSLVLSQTLERYSVYGLGLARKGVHLERGRDVRVLERITVGEVMQPDATSLRETDTLPAAADKLFQTRHHGLPVLNEAGDLVGIFTLQDLDRAHSDESFAAKTVGDVCTRDLEVAHPDETMDLALRRMSVRNLGRMPVVAREDPRHLLGMLRRTDVVRAYDLALTRRAISRNQAQQIRLGAYAGVSVEELRVEPGAACAGKPVKAIAWPADSILVTLRRGGQVMIPHGDTILQPGDVLVVAAEGDARDTLRALCRMSQTSRSGE